MLLSTTGQASPNSIVVNGDFETGDFTGWTISIDPVFDGVDDAAPQAGTYAAFFGNPDGISEISQTITTVPGGEYHISFWLQVESDAFGNPIPNSFEFDWGGTPELALSNLAESPYVQYSFDLTATSTSTELAFFFSDGPAFLDFDSVSAVPEPGSLALVTLAGGLIAFVRRRRSA
ncbi:MAG TPA: carbohydrate binding domain-containing protein [Casimicrobiaceae bacterium]|nr:carbohydrate binding domain-containing protein [Casimicrobiaceae bacterium]